MSNFKIALQCLLLVTTISLQYKSVSAAYTARFLPVWNPVMEGMITICTIPTLHTKFKHSIFKPGSNVVLKNSQNYGQCPPKNYYNIQLSDIHLVPSLCCVKRHTIYKELQKMKCELIFPQTSISESQLDSFLSVFNIRQPLPAHIQLCIQFPNSRSG
jgi:hypothetical protein